MAVLVSLNKGIIFAQENIIHYEIIKQIYMYKTHKEF